MRIPWLLVTLCMKSKVIFGSHFGHYRHSDHLTEALRTIRGLLSPIKKEDVKTNYFWTCKITTTLQILEQVFAFVFWIYPFNIQPLEVSCCLRSGAMFLTLHFLWLFLSMSYVCFCIFIFVFAHVLCFTLYFCLCFCPYVLHLSLYFRRCFCPCLMFVFVFLFLFLPMSYVCLCICVFLSAHMSYVCLCNLWQAKMATWRLWLC